MSPYLVISIVLLAMLVLALVMWMGERRRSGSLSGELAAEREAAGRLREQAALRSVEIARIEAEAAGLRERAETERRDRALMQEAFRAEFEVLAGRIFDEKSRKFKETNRESLDVLLKPFKDNLADFRRRIEDIHSEENRRHGSLKSELRNLMELNQRITRETSNLTSALKGSSKVQGDWGEMILERMLESSNLQRGVHYFVQENFKDETGANVRPDVVLTLPGGKRIVIDSKVSLTAYVEYTSAEEEASRQAHLRRHVASVRSHIAELHTRNYQGAVADSPDFVIMFVPNEPAFMSALQRESALWGEAYDKKVIVSSPTNLFALLKIVDDLWKRDNQSRHALEIARHGGALYDKFVGFVSSLEDVGRGIERAQKSYGEAFGQLSGGRGNLVARAEKLRELGVKASKRLPAGLAGEESEE